MLIKILPVGHLETNCCIVTNESSLECVIIDPGDESNTILDYLESNSLKPAAIFITHGHFDHVGAVPALEDELNLPVYINEKDCCPDNPRSHLPYRPTANTRYYDEGDVIEAAGLSFEILATPGHTPGGVTIKCEDALFTGDTLFHGSCGRTDLPGGDIDQILCSLKKICSLEGDYEVYPGHMDPTTLLRERTLNYYCRKAMTEK